MTNQAKLLKLIINFQLASLICYLLIKASLFKALLESSISMGVIYVDYIHTSPPRDCKTLKMVVGLCDLMSHGAMLAVA